MKYQRKAFTMVELVFVIVILGILASVAIPKLAATRDDAQIVKARSAVSAIRNAITLNRNMRMLQGKTGFPAHLDDAQTTSSSSTDNSLFDGTGTKILDYPLYAKYNSDGHWMKSGTDEYKFRILNTDVVFKYDNSAGSFDCHSDNSGTELTYCKQLTE
jgi:general secretion pathway protein G